MKKLKMLYFKIAFCMIAVVSVNDVISMETQLQMPFLVTTENSKEIDFGYDGRYLKNLTIKKITPENTIFAFDLHEVLFNRYRCTMIWGGFKLFCKTFLYALTHPWLIPSIISVSREPMVCEGMYFKLAEQYPYLQNWKQDVFEISNGCCYPENPMINLVKILKQKGFKVFLLSNIGADTFEDFKTRFRCIDGLFDGIYTPSRANNYSYKPMLKFYEGFKDYIRSVGYENKQILFIDDIERNVVAATQVGIAGIHFKGHKSLCGTLNKIGVTIDAQTCEDMAI